VDVVVFLNTNWAALEVRTTRWSEVATRWARRSGISLRVVSYPKYGRPRGGLVRPTRSWHPDIASFDVTVPLLARRPTPLDDVGWAIAARAVGRSLHVTPATRLVAATPLWAPLLRRLGAWSFDAVDDWRALEVGVSLAARVEEGERELAGARSRTSVSAALSDTLAGRAGAPCVVVSNGVDPDRFAHPDGEAPTGLPDEPFAVYVGTVEGRVDLDLLGVVARVMPVVVAGGADAARAEHLRSLPVTWLGAVASDRIPALLRRASVGLVPHHDTPLTRSMDPMKTLEYLAAGLPVVTTPVADRPEHRDRVVVAEGDGFADAVLTAAALGRALPAAGLRTWEDVADDLWIHHVRDDRT
jgi:glycosyltransferase involved in cell wall biosynthesis